MFNVQRAVPELSQENLLFVVMPFQMPNIYFVLEPLAPLGQLDTVDSFCEPSYLQSQEEHFKEENERTLFLEVQNQEYVIEVLPYSDSITDRTSVVSHQLICAGSTSIRPRPSSQDNAFCFKENANLPAGTLVPSIQSAICKTAWKSKSGVALGLPVAATGNSSGIVVSSSESSAGTSLSLKQQLRIRAIRTKRQG